MTPEQVREIILEMFRDGTLSLEQTEDREHGYGAQTLQRTTIQIVHRRQDVYEPEVLTEVTFDTVVD